MKIHEYQAVEIFKKSGIPVAGGRVAADLVDAQTIAQETGFPVVLKSQVLVGGRGKAGGIKIAKNPEELAKNFSQLKSLVIKGYPVEHVLVVRALEIKKEFYAAVTIDNIKGDVVLIASSEGGVDIEETAKQSPGKIHKYYLHSQKEIDPTRDARWKDFIKAVFPDPAQLDFCYTGVFMEEETALNLITHGIVDKSWLNWPARLTELDKLCRTFQGEKLKACWTELVHIIAVKYNNNAKEVFDYCSQAPEVAAGKSCKRHGIGIMAAGTNFDLMRIKYWCDLPQENDPNWKSDCYIQLAASTISTIPNEQNKIKDFCQSLEATYQSACFGQIKGYNDYTKNAFRND